MGDFNYEDSIKENIDFKLSENKVIIKYIQDQNICFNLIIGAINSYDYNKLNTNVLMFYNKDEELPKIISIKINESICYANDFDIINEKTLLNLKKSMGDFNYEDSIQKKIDSKLSGGKVIIKYIRDKYFCYNLIIGTLNFNGLLNVNFSPEIIVNFKVKDDLEIQFNEDKILEKYSQYNNCKEIIAIQNNYFKEAYISYNIKYLCEGYKDLNDKGMTRLPPGNNDSANIINFFMHLLFFHYLILI
jgi:hypothetical protein